MIIWAFVAFAAVTVIVVLLCIYKDKEGEGYNVACYADPGKDLEQLFGDEDTPEDEPLTAGGAAVGCGCIIALICAGVCCGMLLQLFG